MIRRRYDYFMRHLLGLEPPRGYSLPDEDPPEDGQYE